MPAKEPLVIPLNCLPGIQRDGTRLDSKAFTDGQWVRFVNGRPYKMNGYREINRHINGPVRGMQTWSRQDLTQLTIMSPWGIEAVQIDRFGVGQAIYDRTPTTFVPNSDVVWQTDTMYDAAAGSTKTLLFAHPGSNLSNIDSAIATDVYYGDAEGTGSLQAIGGFTQVSGGVVCLSPYLVLYGSDGQVSWSNANEPRNFTTGDSTTARPTGSKIVKGLSIRGQGASPSGLLWALDSLIRMTYVGGQAVFRFDPITNASSILSSSCVVEYDGIYYWIGIDRFMQYNGRVQELNNPQNKNWFFDNLNYAQRQKVHGVKVTRYGEIWWFFPKGDALECTHAVIYNVRENYWYDVELGRSAGVASQAFRYPVLADSSFKEFVVRVPVQNSAVFTVGDSVSGGTSGSSGIVRKILGADLYVLLSVGTGFLNAETITAASTASSLTTDDSITLAQHQLWLHEFGKNKVEGDDELGIYSFFETADFGFIIGDGQNATPNRWTRLARVEPDFNMVGNMYMQVAGSEAANSPPSSSQAYPFDSTTENIDLREQRRELRLRFVSNEMNGHYEMGKILLHIEQGDGRN